MLRVATESPRIGHGIQGSPYLRRATTTLPYSLCRRERRYRFGRPLTECPVVLKESRARANSSFLASSQAIPILETPLRTPVRLNDDPLRCGPDESPTMQTMEVAELSGLCGSEVSVTALEQICPRGREVIHMTISQQLAYSLSIQLESSPMRIVQGSIATPPLAEIVEELYTPLIGRLSRRRQRMELCTLLALGSYVSNHSGLLLKGADIYSGRIKS